MDKLIFDDRSLKEFFRMFDVEEKLEIIELGDTWHPASGFVDETFFNPIKTVSDLLNTDYDFKGLVFFEASIRGLSVIYYNNRYTIRGDKKEIEKLKYNFT